MTHTPRSNASLARRLLVGSAAAVATLVTIPTSVSAGDTPATSSETIAWQANHAVWLLTQWESTRSPADYAVYKNARALTAQSVAAEFGIPAAALETAWANTDLEKQHALFGAMSQLGVPYRSRMSKANRGFDCSGLVYYAYSQAGIELPRSSGEQIRASVPLDLGQIEPGDLVYYPGHVSMYLGDNLVVHSPQSGKDVEVRTMFERSLRFGDPVAAQP